jgi:AcrR family transcriptional regulator
MWSKSEVNILESAAELFYKNRNRVIRFREVAEHAGVTTRTLYNYYPNRHKLADEVRKYNQYVFYTSLKAVSENGNLSFFEKIDAAIDVLFREFSKRDVKLFKDDKSDEESLDSEFTDLIGIIVAEGKAQGLVTEKLSATLLAYIIVPAVTGSIVIRDARGLDLYPADIFKRSVSLFLTGILTEHGREVYASGSSS